jgi:hypothetical protein
MILDAEIQSSIEWIKDTSLCDTSYQTTQKGHSLRCHYMLRRWRHLNMTPLMDVTVRKISAAVEQRDEGKDDGRTHCFLAAPFCFFRIYIL